MGVRIPCAHESIWERDIRQFMLKSADKDNALNGTESDPRRGSNGESLPGSVIFHNRLALNGDPLRELQSPRFVPPIETRGLVKEAFLKHIAENFDQPQLRPFQRALNQQGVRVEVWEVKRIIDTTRAEAPKSEKHLWRFSGKRVNVGWPAIIAAHRKAKDLLKSQGVRREPASEEVVHFLEKENHKISPRALEFRFAARPELVNITLAPYSDTTLTAAKTCHRRLSATLKRDPNIHELTEAVNAIVLTPLTFEALWMRITRYNEQRSSKKITLTPTLPSGIYDADITNSYEAQKQARGRAPTTRELFSAVKAACPGKRMRYDTFQRRLSHLELELTHENTLKSAQQTELKEAIVSLAYDLGRRPLKHEVINLLSEQKSTIQESDLTRILGTLKRRLPLAQRKAYHLILPHHGYGDLVDACRQHRKRSGDEPTISDLSRLTGWSEKGVSQFIPTAQRIASHNGKPPLLIKDSPLALDRLFVREFAEAVRAKVNDPSVQFDGSLKDISSELKSVLQDWFGKDCRKPAFFLKPEELSDVRLKIVWIAAHYQHTAAQRLTENDLQKLRVREIGWALRHQYPTLRDNPFSGAAHALASVVAMERVGSERIPQLFSDLDSSVKGKDLRPGVFELIDEVARGLGY